MAAASDLRQSLYAYYSLRNRFLFVRRNRRHTALPLAVLALRATLRSMASLLGGNVTRARSETMGLIDGLRGRFGPANERFLT